MMKRKLYLDLREYGARGKIGRERLEFFLAIIKDANSQETPRIPISEISEICFVCREGEKKELEQLLLLLKTLKTQPALEVCPQYPIPKYSFSNTLPAQLEPSSVVRKVQTYGIEQGCYGHRLVADEVTPFYLQAPGNSENHSILPLNNRPLFSNLFRAAHTRSENQSGKNTFKQEIENLEKSLITEISQANNFWRDPTNKVYKLSFVIQLKSIVAQHPEDIAEQQKQIRDLLLSPVNLENIPQTIKDTLRKDIQSPYSTYKEVGNGFFSHRTKDLLLKYLQVNSLENLLNKDLKQKPKKLWFI